MQRMEDYLSLIEEGITGLQFPGGDLAALYEPIAYGLEAGGKRLRPVLTLMAAGAFGMSGKQALPAALAVEMFHNFTLLHDDVMDNSPTRRGRPSVMAAYGADQAILSGDTMYSLAVREMMSLKSDRVWTCLEVLNDTAIEVYEGQQLDISFERRSDVSLAEYMEMIRLKTSVLLGAACKIGALAADANSQDAHALYVYGENLGLAFQIMDDYLDVYGEASTFGKPIGGDILNNKKTWLMLSALASPKGPELQRVMEGTEGEERINKVRGIYDAIGLPGKAREAIARYTNDAIAVLDKLSCSAGSKDAFADLARKLLSRSK